MNSSYQPSEENTNQHNTSTDTSSKNTSVSVQPSTPSNNDDINKNDHLDSSATTLTMDDEGRTYRPVTEVAVNTSPRLRNLSNVKVLEKKFCDGYDSDGENGPFNNMEELEGPQMVDEEELPVGKLVEARIEENNDDRTVIQGNFVDIAEDRLRTMKRDELKEELRLRGQALSGNKDALLSRLKEALVNNIGIGYSNKENVNKQKNTKEKKKPAGMGAFCEGAYWEVLQADDTPVQEPANINFKKARAPTIPEEDAIHVPVKYNFSKNKFDVPEFKGKMQKVVRWANGNAKKDKNGKFLMESSNITAGCVNPDIIKKYNLTPESGPEEYINLIMPAGRNAHDGKEYFSFFLIKNWTNLKASLAGAGAGGDCYLDFVPFTTREIRQHYGLCVLQGCNSSPQVEMKFNPQSVDKIHGNDFVCRSFGSNALRRHRHFKCFLACQDPRIDPPDRKVDPNWKIRPLLKWMNYFFPIIWLLACEFSVDEMTMGFKGKHQDKKRITHKAEGDGFQADALCQNGFCYQVCMRNDLAPRKFLKMGLSPLHSRVMALFDTLKNMHHQCAMDNLHNSAAFCKAAFNHSKKVLTHGVTRLGSRGVPPCVHQLEIKNRKQQISVRGTVKAAVLRDDPDCPNLVASSVYDAKPVHYLSMVCNELKWVTVDKPVYNVESGEVEKLSFLRLNNIAKYNKEMGDVDLADQLRGNYRLDKNIRNRKWWWSIMFWSVGTMLTNAYVMYCVVNLLHFGKKKTDIMTHLQFREAIAEYWINPEEYLSRKKKHQYSNDSFLRKRKTSSNSHSSTSSLTIDSTLQEPKTKKQKLPTRQCNDSSLSPDGSLKERLDTCLDHLPSEKESSRARCALHRWLGIETTSQISQCKTCSVHLCIQCYRLFHTEPNLVNQKNRLQKKYSK